MHCKHKRVFEGSNHVKKKPEEIQKEREEDEEGKGRRCEAKNYLHGPLAICLFAFFKNCLFIYLFLNNFILL